MTTETDTIDILAEAEAAATNLANRYGDWANRDDILQEIILYSLEGGRKHLTKWAGDGERHRVQLALRGAGKQYCEQEKAAASGYHFNDIAWYAPEKLADLIPLATNPRWDGISGESDDENSGRGQTAGREGGGLLAMVIDVRRAIASVGAPYLDDDGEIDDVYLAQLSEFLGGDYPDAPGYHRGRRPVLSNAAAIAATREGDS